MKQRNIGNVLLYVKRKRASGLFSTHLSGTATVKILIWCFIRTMMISRCSKLAAHETCKAGAAIICGRVFIKTATI